MQSLKVFFHLFLIFCVCFIFLLEIFNNYTGEWWISKRNFNKTCIPTGTYIMNCLSDSGIPIKLNRSITLGGIRYKFVSIPVKIYNYSNDFYNRIQFFIHCTVNCFGWLFEGLSVRSLPFYITVNFSSLRMHFTVNRLIYFRICLSSIHSLYTLINKLTLIFMIKHHPATLLQE